jgi:hypothetical protein
MTCNYRVIKKGDYLTVHAVYYDNDGTIKGWSENPFSPEAEDLDELRASLKLMLESLDKDVIDLESISENGE